MKHGSLFSGIGGFDLAAEWMEWENKFHCEINPFCQKILKYYWPNAISYGDIKTTDFSIHRGKIDILTGGFPCQPYSTAGKRKGKEDERHLWPEMLRSIIQIQPSWVVGENVLGLVNWSRGLVFDEVQADLEAAGYEVFPYVLPACAKNAPHRRDRVWFVAYNEKWSYWKYNSESTPRQKQEFGTGFGRDDIFTNSNGTGWEKKYTSPESNKEKFNSRGAKHPYCTSESWKYVRQERKGQFNGSNSRNGISKWQDFPTESPICRGNDGLSEKLDGITFPKWRNESIKAYGNAIVPQVVFEIFKAIESYEKQNE